MAPPYEATVEDIVRNAKGQLTKGHSGNLAGMPPGTPSLVRLLRKRLIKHPEDAEAIVNALVRLGKAGDMRAIEHLFDRIDGKMVERHEIAGEMPVRIQFVPAEGLLEIATEPSLMLEKGYDEETEERTEKAIPSSESGG